VVLVTVLAAGALSQLHASAPAATVSFLDLDGESPYPGVLYVAAPGEANDALITFEPGERAVTVVDPGATITPGAFCIGVDVHTARCTAPDRPGWTPRLAWARVRLGDGDDRLRSVGTDDLGQGDMVVLAGPGDDTIHGGNGSDRLDGGGGIDELRGGGGWDWLSDGDRDGAAGVLAPGPDVLDAGSGGRERLDYSKRTQGVTLDLADPATDGARGEGDVLLGSFEFVYGGAGDDVIAGTDRRERLIGGAGTDLLVGRGGDDWFRGVDDDTVSCGAGVDTLRRLDDGVPLVEPDCERYIHVDPASFDQIPWPLYPVAIDGRVLRFSIPCVNEEAGQGGNPGFPCSARIRLWTAGSPRRPLASARVSRFDSEHTVAVRLNRLGVRLAHRDDGVLAIYNVRARNLPDVRWKLRLTLPG
jgi:RTX calcium-binding nonapeptide repeat (4 copies)